MTPRCRPASGAAEEAPLPLPPPCSLLLATLPDPPPHHSLRSSKAAGRPRPAAAAATTTATPSRLRRAERQDSPQRGPPPWPRPTQPSPPARKPRRKPLQVFARCRSHSQPRKQPMAAQSCLGSPASLLYWAIFPPSPALSAWPNHDSRFKATQHAL